jgi:hypothetical protein
MEKRAPITVRFEIPYFTVSGIQVRYLKIVEKSGYQALPWVRYAPVHVYCQGTNPILGTLRNTVTITGKLYIESQGPHSRYLC